MRIVADIGLHTGWPIPAGSLVPEGEWTPELAQRMLVDYALVEPTLAGFEVDRYLGWPGQALAFKVGARLWNEARARGRRSSGTTSRCATSTATPSASARWASTRSAPCSPSPDRGARRRAGGAIGRLASCHATTCATFSAVSSRERVANGRFA